MARESRDHSTGVTISGLISAALTTYANRLVMTNALNSKGALGRSLLVPVPRLLARFFRWWSRGWVGQVLGLGWSVATFQFGVRNQLDPAEIGDHWRMFRRGNVKPAFPKKPGA